MKKIFGILVSLMMCFTLSSCITTAAAQIDDVYDDVDISVVVTYGTPFYNTEGLIVYYIYRDMFYYPYLYHNRYYLHRYSRPLPPERLLRYRPVPRNFYRNYPPRRGDIRPNNPPRGRNENGRPNNPPRRVENVNVRPTQPQVRPNTNVNVRPTQPQTRPNTNFGTSRQQQQVRPTIPNINRGGTSVRPSTPPRTTNSNGSFGGSRSRR